jgi:hypothetical protein
MPQSCNNRVSVLPVRPAPITNTSQSVIALLNLPARLAAAKNSGGPLESALRQLR